MEFNVKIHCEINVELVFHEILRKKNFTVYPSLNSLIFLYFNQFKIDLFNFHSFMENFWNISTKWNVHSPPPPAPTPSWLGWLKLTKACVRMVSITWFLIMCKLSTLSRLQTFLAETIPNFVLDCEEKTGRCPLLSSYCTLSN